VFYSQIMRIYPVVIAGLLASCVLAQQTPPVIGGISSTAPVEIDGTSMAPAPSWPLVDRDVVQTTTAPGMILTPDQNSITLLPGTAVRIRSLPPRQTWLFVREGGLSVDTKNTNVMVCAANRVFQPAGATRGSIQLDKSGSITRAVTNGSIAEIRVTSCGEELAAGMTGQAGPVAGGTATAPSPTGNRKNIAAALLAFGGSIGLSFFGGSPAVNCSAPGSCNFNPPPVSASGP